MVDVMANSTIKIIAKMIFTWWVMDENETENKHFLPHPKKKKKVIQIGVSKQRPAVLYIQLSIICIISTLMLNHIIYQIYCISMQLKD